MVASSVALKEWSVVVEALGTGDQLLLVRKGGIQDPKGAFQLEHREFLFYPTREHQRAEAIRPDFRDRFQKAFTQLDDPQEVTFAVYGGVAFCAEIRDPAQLAGLEKYHIWTPEFFKERMSYRPQSPTLVVLLRAYRLKPPVRHPVEPEYAGCKSWVNLGLPVSVEGAEPVVDNRRFRQILEEAASYFAE